MSRRPHSTLNRVLEPSVLMEMTMTNGTVKTFEVSIIRMLIMLIDPKNRYFFNSPYSMYLISSSVML